MKLTRLTSSLLALSLALAGASAASALQGPPQGPPPGYGPPPPPPPQGWDAPPSRYAKDIQRRGYHDGIDGARKDYGNRRAPNVNNRDEYRRPPNVPPQFYHMYRAAFRDGYARGVQVFYGPRRR